MFVTPVPVIPLIILYGRRCVDLLGRGAYTRTTRNQAGSGIRSAASISAFLGGDARRRRPDMVAAEFSVEEQFTEPTRREFSTFGASCLMNSKTCT